MSASKVTDQLMAMLEHQGFKAQILSVKHVPELQLAIKENLESGKIDKAVYRDYRTNFDNKATQDVPWARSIIIIAAPRPMLEVIFTINNEKKPTIVPPTYEHSIDETITATIEAALAPSGYRITPAALPKKLLATRSGLARYGKNNITYVAGLGSFIRLLTFYTDLPTVNDNWQEPQVLDQCTGCKACINKCPTGAIDPNQFQLHAEKCLTYHNESSDRFPQWIDKSWHHCLVGCMKCQQNCPANKDVRFWTEPYAEFSEQETALLLSGQKETALPKKWTAKFQNSDLSKDPAALARNLRSVLENSELQKN